MSLCQFENYYGTIKRKCRPNILQLLRKRSQGVNGINNRYCGVEVMRSLLTSSKSNFKLFAPYNDRICMRENIQSCDNDFLICKRTNIGEMATLTVDRIVNIGSELKVQTVEKIPLACYGHSHDISHEVHAENRHYCDHSQYLSKEDSSESLNHIIEDSAGFYDKLPRSHFGDNFKPYGIILASNYLVQYHVETGKVMYKERLPRLGGIRYSEIELDRGKCRAIIISNKQGTAANKNLYRTFMIYSTWPMQKLIVMYAHMRTFPKKFLKSYGTPSNFMVYGDIFCVTTSKKFILVFDFERILEEKLRSGNSSFIMDYDRYFRFAVKSHYDFLSLSHYNVIVRDSDFQFRFRNLRDVMRNQEDSNRKNEIRYGESGSEESFVGFPLEESLRMVEIVGGNLTIYHAEFNEKKGKVVGWNMEFDLNPRREEKEDNSTLYTTRSGRQVTLQNSYFDAMNTRDDLITIDLCPELRLIVSLIYTKDTSPFENHILFKRLLIHDLYSYELLREFQTKDLSDAGLEPEITKDNKDVSISISYDMLIIFTGVRYLFLVLNGLTK